MVHNIFNIDGSPHPAETTQNTELYLRALRYIIAGKEEKAGFALNLVRDTLLEAAHSSNFADSHLQTIMPDLTIRKFNALYGDFKYTEGCRKKHQYDSPAQRPTAEWDRVSTPWINQEDLLRMVATHLVKLGDEDDRENCKVFLQKAHNLFRVPVPMELVA